MKGSGTLMASVLAASTVALGSSSSSSAGDLDVASLCSSSNEGFPSSSERKKMPNTTSDKEKFAPRFDGLRFIETLVTAHR